MTSDDVSKSKKTWKEIAEELAHEQDPGRIKQLTEELSRAMLEEERHKVRERMRHRAEGT